MSEDAHTIDPKVTAVSDVPPLPEPGSLDNDPVIDDADDAGTETQQTLRAIRDSMGAKVTGKDGTVAEHIRDSLLSGDETERFEAMMSDPESFSSEYLGVLASEVDSLKDELAAKPELAGDWRKTKVGKKAISFMGALTTETASVAADVATDMLGDTISYMGALSTVLGRNIPLKPDAAATAPTSGELRASLRGEAAPLSWEQLAIMHTELMDVMHRSVMPLIRALSSDVETLGDAVRIREEADAGGRGQQEPAEVAAASVIASGTKA